MIKEKRFMDKQGLDSYLEYLQDKKDRRFKKKIKSKRTKIQELRKREFMAETE